ncbi:hypothetical protein [Streptomyces sp. NPDC058426]|uniref:hypothetical protein n=1 Tax=Streptomyces sp. NPDC058426 TaxID=3346493 RepID=UPI003651A0CC
MTVSETAWPQGEGPGFVVAADGSYAARIVPPGGPDEGGTAGRHVERWTLGGPEPFAVPLPVARPEPAGTEAQPLPDGRVLVHRPEGPMHYFSLLYPSGPDTGEQPLGAVEHVRADGSPGPLRLLPPSPVPGRVYALAPGLHSTAVWLVAGGAFGPEHLAEIPGRCAGGVWLDREARMLAVDRTGEDGVTKAVAVDLERAGEVSPLLQISERSDDRLLSADVDSGLLLIRSNAPGQDRLAWGVLGSALPVRFPECLELSEARLTPFAVQPGQDLLPEHSAVAFRVDGPVGGSWIGVWRPVGRRLHQLPAPRGWLAGGGLWTRDGVLRLPYAEGTGPCGLARVTWPSGSETGEVALAASSAGGPASPRDGRGDRDGGGTGAPGAGREDARHGAAEGGAQTAAPVRSVPGPRPASAPPAPPAPVAPPAPPVEHDRGADPEDSATRPLPRVTPGQPRPEAAEPPERNGAGEQRPGQQPQPTRPAPPHEHHAQRPQPAQPIAPHEHPAQGTQPAALDEHPARPAAPPAPHEHPQPTQPAAPRDEYARPTPAAAPQEQYARPTPPAAPHEQRGHPAQAAGQAPPPSPERTGPHAHPAPHPQPVPPRQPPTAPPPPPAAAEVVRAPEPPQATGAFSVMAVSGFSGVAGPSTLAGGLGSAGAAIRAGLVVTRGAVSVPLPVPADEPAAARNLPDSDAVPSGITWTTPPPSGEAATRPVPLRDSPLHG